MKKLALLLVLGVGAVAAADEITFSIVGAGLGVDITSSPGGLVAGPANTFEVTDISTGASFPLTGAFNVSAGAAHTVTVGPTVYLADFSAGGAGSVSIAGAVTGDLHDLSHISAVYPNSQGSFAGEFDVTFFDPAILAKFGIKGKIAPVGSVGITFGQDAVNGQMLTGVIGGATTTVLTVTTVPEPNTVLMFLFGIGTVVAVWRARQLRE